jgi:hypothetical protein
LLPSTQQKIVKAVYRLWNDVGRALGRETLTHSEGIQIFNQYFGEGGIPIPWLLQTIATDLLPPHAPDATANFREQLALVDTEEKLEEFLLNRPEPSSEQLDEALKWINNLLPGLRKLLQSRTKAIPHSRGGAPKKLSSTQDQETIREEIKGLRGPGTKLTDIYSQIARRHGVSASKIKQIWLRSPK